MAVFDEPNKDILDFASTFFTSGELDDLNLFISLEDPTASALVSDSLPLGGIELPRFSGPNRLVLQQTVPGMRIEGEITSFTFIPGPSAALCLLGLAALLLQRRRRVLW